MNNMAAYPPMQPVLPGHPSRRQNDFSYSPQPQHPHHQHHHMPYPGYPHHPPPPPHHFMPQQYYMPYQHYTPPPNQPPRHYQPQSPLIVSSHPHAQPVVPSVRPPFYTPQSTRTPQPDQSTTSSASQALASPSTTATTASVNTPTPPAQPSSKTPASAPPPPPTPTHRAPFQPPLPWFSVSESSFPVKGARRRRKRRTAQLSGEPLELLVKPPSQAQNKDPQPSAASHPTSTNSGVAAADHPRPAEAKTDQFLETNKNETARPSSQDASPPKTRSRAPTKPVIPAIPNLPNKASTVTSPPTQPAKSAGNPNGKQSDSAGQVQPSASQPDITSAPLAPKAPPKSWAELLRQKNPAPSAPRAAVTNAAGFVANDLQAPKANSLTDVLKLYDVGSESKISFLEPRGLVNTGNMCYMNSVLQILVFCVPFFEFLDQLGKRASLNFKSETPLIEAMITFMREFNIIDSAVSADQLRFRLKDNELEQYGEPFIPEYVYEVIKRLPRFSTMRRGHQQDAEEFLGFLLEGLHDECVQVIRRSSTDHVSSSNASASSPPPSEPSTSGKETTDGGWLEVGPKQKPSVTRSSGSNVTDSPVTKIFGGKLRSEFRVPGLKNSVTLEPYQPLQLDIGDPSVSNITDALRNLTRSETIHGNFNSPRGPGASATKQVFIETLPPVLILHLKRFQYDTSIAGGLGSTQKIWKRVGYPLELEIPKEVFPSSKRGQYASRPQGLPKYRLISVVYHHGKNAGGGHYTVDVRRQEGREWVRMDDTVIRRVRSEDVASEGGEEDPKVLAAALEKHKAQQNGSSTPSDANGNLYEEFANGQGGQGDEDDEQGWSQVNGTGQSPTAIANASTSGTGKKWSGVFNGTALAQKTDSSQTGKSTPRATTEPSKGISAKDSKVAYILFYQQIKA